MSGMPLFSFILSVLSLLTLPNEFWAVSAQQRLPLLLLLLVLFFGLRLQCMMLCSIQTNLRVGRDTGADFAPASATSSPQ